MKTIRKFAMALGVLTLVSATAFAQDIGKVKIAHDASYPPFGYKDSSGEIVGFDIDITLAACREAQLECEFVAQDWDGLIPGLLVKKYSAISSSMIATEERKKTVNFTDKVYQVPTRFLVRKGTSMTFDAKGLEGKSLGAQRASIQADYLEEHYSDSSAIKLYETADQMNLDLAAGRVDAILQEVLSLQEGFLKTETGAKFEFQGPDFKFGEGIAIATRKADTELMQRLNKGIQAIRNSGEYQKISQQYFGMDIY